MSAIVRKKTPLPSAYPAAKGLFEHLAGLFASPSINKKLILKTIHLDASLKALQQAPPEEVAAVSQILLEISASVFRLSESVARRHRSSKRGAVKPSATAIKAANKEDAIVARLLARTHDSADESELTAEQLHTNAELVSRLRRESAAALQRRIASKELLHPKEFQDALGISRQSINEAVKARRIFAVLGPSGEYYYPAFYADGDLNRRELEKVAKILGGVPATSKYHFFTSKSTYLGSATPLTALKKGRLNDVLIAAAAFESANCG